MRLEADITANFVGECKGPDKQLNPKGIYSHTFYVTGETVFDCKYLEAETKICKPATLRANQPIPCIILDIFSKKETNANKPLSLVISGLENKEPLVADTTRAQIIASPLWEKEHPRQSINRMEAKLLGFLMSHPNKVHSPDELLNVLWGSEPPKSAYHILQTYINFLRIKLNDYQEKDKKNDFKIIKTIMNGYYVSAEIKSSSKETDLPIISCIIPKLEGKSPLSMKPDLNEVSSSPGWETDQLPVTLPAKCSQILEALIKNQGIKLSKDYLISLIWPDEKPRTATITLQSYIYQLRKILGDNKIKIGNKMEYQIIKTSSDKISYFISK